jgi:hypothetical protein
LKLGPWLSELRLICLTACELFARDEILVRSAVAWHGE